MLSWNCSILLWVFWKGSLFILSNFPIYLMAKINCILLSMPLFSFLKKLTYKHYFLINTISASKIALEPNLKLIFFKCSKIFYFFLKLILIKQSCLIAAAELKWHFWWNDKQSIILAQGKIRLIAKYYQSVYFHCSRKGFSKMLDIPLYRIFLQ